MRSISTKLILAFLSIGIISVAFISITARWNTRAEFISFLSDQSRDDLVLQLTEYYLVNGSWTGVEGLLRQTAGLPPGMGMGMGQGRGHMRLDAITLCDPFGRVIFSTENRLKPGSQIPEVDLESGTPITNNDQVVGVFISAPLAFGGNPRELEFIERTNRTLLYGVLIGAAIALLLGILLSRTLTRPIRELTAAAHAIAQGNLSQQVSVRSRDELGELAQTFNKMSAELARSVNVRKQMTADIAHELRTPLSLILGHAEAVHDSVLPPTRENFEIIREEAERLEHLVNDLRTLSLADAGELTITPQPIEPERLLNEVAALYQYQTRAKDISLHLDIASPLPLIEVDPGRMTQVLTNILDNALRHTPADGQITLSAKQTDGEVELAIQDSGPGVPAEMLERIFERFYRTDSARQRDGTTPGGSGLGLAIAKSIVQTHNGQISAESEAGKGLRISLRLPKKP